MIEYTGVCLKANSPCIQSFSEAIDICETITKIHKSKFKYRLLFWKVINSRTQSNCHSNVSLGGVPPMYSSKFPVACLQSYFKAIDIWEIICKNKIHKYKIQIQAGILKSN